MLKAAEEVENEFLIGYVRLLIDILNVITFVRLRQIKKPWTFFQKVFLEGGSKLIFLLLGKMPFLEALMITFGTAGTGGFGVRNSSIGGYSPYIQWWFSHHTAVIVPGTGAPISLPIFNSL